jgi:hypothetical protein
VGLFVGTAVAEAGVVRRWIPLFALLGACTGELRELGGMPDGGGAGGGDMAQQKMPPQVTFAMAIQKDLDESGCSLSACHGSITSPMHLVANATQGADLAANYGEVKSRATAGGSSLLLEKPLMGSPVQHAGGKQFQSASDATYARWLAWIDAGAPSGLALAGDAGESGTDGGM